MSIAIVDVIGAVEREHNVLMLEPDFFYAIEERIRESGLFSGHEQELLDRFHGVQEEFEQTVDECTSIIAGALSSDPTRFQKVQMAETYKEYLSALVKESK